MDFVEGISNEVLVAFILTIFLIVVAVYYIFFSERSSVSLRGGGNQTIPTPNVYRSETGDNIAENPNETDNSSTANTTREETCNPPHIQDSVDFVEQSESGREDNVRRRVVNDMGQDRSTGRQDETMVVKVKHNENTQTFNVSTNITVIELKRLAFNNELNAGQRVRFVYAGQLLRNDNDPLTQYGVLPNTVVHCVISDSPEQQTAPEQQEEDIDISRLLIPLMTVALIMAWYGVISYKHIFTGASIAILMFLTSLYVILVYVTTIQ